MVHDEKKQKACLLAQVFQQQAVYIFFSGYNRNRL